MRRLNQQQLYSQGAGRLITLDSAGAALDIGLRVYWRH
jgi:hypothetical protein